MHAHRRPFPLLILLLGLGLWLAGAPQAVAKDPEPWRIAFIGPLEGPLADSAAESLQGLRLCVERWNATFDGVQGAPVEIVTYDDGDDAERAAAAVDAAAKAKVSAVVAASTALTVDAVADRARRRRLPTILVGSAAPRPTLDPADPVMCVGSWPVAHAMEIANVLALHSDNDFLGLFGDTVEPAIVHEDSPRGAALADALARNLGPRQHLAGRIAVAPHGAVDGEAVAALREARCDRLVVLGEPDLLDAVADALGAAKWDVPITAGDMMLSRAAKSVHDGRLKRANFVVGVMQAVADAPPTPVKQAVEAERGEGALPYPRVVNAYQAGELLRKGAMALKRPGGTDLVRGVRAVSYGDGESGMPWLDETGRTGLYHWFLWRTTEKGPERVNPKYLPTGDLGPRMLMKKPADWDRFTGNEDTLIVYLTFGDENSKQPRTIEKDMGRLGLGTRGYEGDLDGWMLDELMARTLGKINRLFRKNYDGSFIPGVSWNIRFTTTKPDLKAHKYWKGVIAGDDETAGGRAWPGERRVEIYSTYMLDRTDPPLRDRALSVKMGRADKPFIDGTYNWGSDVNGNIRSGELRSLVDAFASYFSLTGAHEFGHVAGLGHDEESGRSIMNVMEGGGIRDTNAWFIPSHQKVLNKLIGLYE